MLPTSNQNNHKVHQKNQKSWCIHVKLRKIREEIKRWNGIAKYLFMISFNLMKRKNARIIVKSSHTKIIKDNTKSLVTIIQS